MYIRIEDSNGKTLKDVWTLWVRDTNDRLELVLDNYVRLMRPTSRHRNWNVVQRWNRVYQRNDTLPARPEVPPQVLSKLMKEATERLHIVLDWA